MKMARVFLVLGHCSRARVVCAAAYLADVKFCATKTLRPNAQKHDIHKR